MKLAKNKKQKKAKKQNLNAINPSNTELKILLEHYQNGRYGDAEKLAQSLTQQFPAHQFGWKMLGAVLKQTGRVSDSLTAMQKSVQLAPQDAEPHYNLGNTFKELGRLNEAKASWTQAIALKPDFAEAYSNLGNTLQQQGRLDEAEESCKQAIALKPGFAAAYNNLGVTLQELGKLDESEESCRQAIVLKPDFAEAHNNLGVTLQELSKLDEAEASYTLAIALEPDFAEARYNLGITLHKLGRLDEAEASYALAIALKPDYAEACYNLGITLQKLGKLDEAEASYTLAIGLKSDHAEAHSNLGNTLKDLGRLEEAEAHYRQAIVLKPDYAEAHRHLTLMKKFDAQDKQYSQMLELYLDENISEEQRCHINFGLAKACEDLGDFEQAFSHYSEGNVLRKKLLNYDINQDVELFRQIEFNYPQMAQNSLEPDKLSKNLMPIFIVGMPRSGTTLVEQIISSHSKVTGAGELSFADQFGSSIARGLSDSNTDSLLNFREKYLIKLQNVANDNHIVTDKMPQNFRYIGLLAAAFPEARIVHVNRNPSAVCWGNYKQHFTSESMGYSFGLDDVVAYYALYQNLLEFWGMKLSNRIYNLDYELLTTNQDEETRQLIDYLGLTWEEKCLSPQNNTRSVATASNTQIRKEVYQGSSEQWKKYEPFLNGVFNHFYD